MLITKTKAMKTIVLITTLIFFLFNNQLLAQNASELLDINNINARIGVETLFNDAVNATAGFETPKGSGKHTMYAGNLWIAGQDVNGQFKGYVATYGTGTNRRGGPIMNSGAYPPANSIDLTWDRVWKVNATDVQNHIVNYANSGYVMPESFMTWPAHGDTTKGQAKFLAPFFDRNGDQFYDPTDGDYPLIKGDQAIYFIYNDVRGLSVIPSMQLEIHAMAYAFDCASDSAINNTIFLDYTLINRSSITSFDTHIGFWADLDIGNAEDDYVGSDVERGTFYGYNGDNMDEDNNGTLGYGSTIPVQGVTFLKGPLQDVDLLDNPLTTNVQDAINMNGVPYAGLGLGYGDGIVDNEYLGLKNFIYYQNGSGLPSFNGVPTNALDYYNYLKGFWRDGSNMVYGGTGHTSSGGTVNADFMFPRDSDPLNWGTLGVPVTPLNWSEDNGSISGTPNTPSDRRGLGSTGPFTFEPGSVETITLAFTTGIDYQTTGNLAGIAVMRERIDSIRSYFNDDFATVCNSTVGVDENDLDESLLKIYPNPFNDQLTINYELKSNAVAIEVYNLIGEKMITTTMNQNQTTINLTGLVDGIYLLHVIDGGEYVTKKIIKQ